MVVGAEEMKGRKGRRAVRKVRGCIVVRWKECGGV